MLCDFESGEVAKRFFVSRRTGFYLAIARERIVGSGDGIKALARDPNGIPVPEITRLYADKRSGDADVVTVRRALRVEALPESWKEYFRGRLERMHGGMMEEA